MKKKIFRRLRDKRVRIIIYSKKCPFLRPRIPSREKKQTILFLETSCVRLDELVVKLMIPQLLHNFVRYPQLFIVNVVRYWIGKTALLVTDVAHLGLPFLRIRHD